MAAPEQDLLEDKIQNVRRRDRRFSRNAYYFVLDALDYTMTHLGRDELTGEDRHIGGKELVAGIREYAADQFGPMATIVFERWGVRSSADFGEIVFNLIDAELLSDFQLTRERFLRHGYTRNAPQEGWLLAFAGFPAMIIDQPRPESLVFRPNGWAEMDDDNIAYLYADASIVEEGTPVWIELLNDEIDPPADTE